MDIFMKRITSKLMLLVLVVVFTFSTTLAFAITPLPDLKFTSVSITSETPSNITYNCTIKNSGTATIPDLYYVTIQNFFSDNGIFNDAGDIAGGGRILAVHRSLAPGESYSFSYYSVISSAGKAYLTAKIDWSNSITELNENNNTFAIGIN